MERYWCLRWLTQEQARQVDAVVLKDEVLRLVDIPLVIKLPGMPPVARGAQVKLDLLRWDEVDLTVEARLLEVEAVPANALAEEESDEGEEGDGGAVDAEDVDALSAVAPLPDDASVMVTVAGE
jgi:exoribonuclease-2